MVGREKRSQIVPLLASVCDTVRIDQILEAWRPDTIYHAAAYKHVPLVEHNPAVGVWNNVFGTMTLAQAACRHGISDFVFISTDKAVRPTNIMGTTKRLAEQVLQALAATQAATRLSMVRFGNVLGSSGSVVPLFRQQIEAGGPITVTHPDITRYFMTISEAAQLVIQAGAMANGGEVFVLDMGSPVKIVTLAKMMVELSGATLRTDDKPDGDIEIKYVGLRPGEKLYEELLIGNNPAATGHPRIMKASEGFLAWPILSAELKKLQFMIHGREIEPLIELLQQLVPEYAAEAASVDWLHLKRSEYRGTDGNGVGAPNREMV
jgi:FlaA1/EpsC-like NDP-sugar epimerase